MKREYLRESPNCNLHISCAISGDNRKKRLRCAGTFFPSQFRSTPIRCEVYDHGEHKSNAKFSQPIAGGKRPGPRSCHHRRNVSVGLLRKFRERSLHSCGLRRPHPILHQGRALSGRVEGGNGIGRESRGDGGSDAGGGGNLSRYIARRRIADAPGGLCGVSVSRESVDVRVGHGVGLGVAGSSVGIAFACGGARRSSLGRGCIARAATAVLPVVVI